ncbi:MAG: DUF4292 domain-containing protein [Tangfeifania sp.]
MRNFIFLGFVIAVAFSSCRTTRDLTAEKVRPISTGKLLKKVEQNTFDYDYLTIRRINCRFSGSEKNTNFKIRLQAQKDEKILVSISKINIPVGRVLLTPDSVKYVNYIDRNYFVDDYTYLSSFLNIDLDFESVQSILSNNAFSYRNDNRNKDFRTFETSVEDGLYLLQSEKGRKIKKLEGAGNKQKIQRRLQRFDDEALIFQKMYFIPDNFALTMLIIEDITNSRMLRMNFSDFEKVEKQDYPGTIEMNVISPRETISLSARMYGFSTDKIDNISLRVPEKYEQIRVN